MEDGGIPLMKFSTLNDEDNASALEELKRFWVELQRAKVADELKSQVWSIFLRLPRTIILIIPRNIVVPNTF
jgi:hypothetical protein